MEELGGKGMKRYLFGRIFGIFLAGILMIESSIPVFATEISTELQQVEAVEEVEQEEIAEVETIKVKEDEEAAQTESQNTQQSEAEVATSEAVSTESQMSTTEDASLEVETTDESEQSEDVTQESTSEAVTDETVEDETEEETEITTEEMVEQLPQTASFSMRAAVTAPSQVSVIKKTATTAMIFWETIEGYTEYQIYRKSDTEADYRVLDNKVIETTSNVGAFLDTSCESGKVYYYKICAVVTSDGKVESQGPFSEEVSNRVDLQQIVLNKSELAMEKGEEEVLSVSYAPSFAEGMYKVTWTSSNEKVATVEAGKVSAVGTGTTVITAMAGNKTATCEVTVSLPLEGLVLSTDQLELAKGEDATVSVRLEPVDTTDSVDYQWSSSDENVAIVVADKQDAHVARIIAKSEGNAIISVSAGGMKAECKVRVKLPITDLALSDYKVQLLENNDSVDVEIKVDTSDKIAYEIDNPELVKCELNEQVLTLKSQGVLGMTKVHVTVGMQTVELAVEVVEERTQVDTNESFVPVSDIEVSVAWRKKGEEVETKELPMILYLGDEVYSTATVSAKVSPANATNKQVGWEISDKSVATVDENGVVTAVGIGRTNITATADNGLEEKITVIVLPGERTFDVEDSKITLYCNENLPDKIKNKRSYQVVLPSDMTFEYRSSNEEIATVDENGQITAHKPGKAAISVIGVENGNVKTIQVTVKKAIESIELPLDEITVIEGTKPEIAFKVLPADASIDCLNTISIKASDDEHIEIDSNWTKGKSSGTFKFSAIKGTDKEQTITITAGDTNNTAIVKKEIKVKVKKSAAQASSIKITGQNKMQSETSQQLGVDLKDRSGNLLNTSLMPIGYVSSDTEIATVDENGKVTAHKGGKATITAYVMNGSNIKADYAITVEQRPTDIVFDRSVYGVSKAVNQAVVVALKPIFVPATTVNKNVTWAVSEIRTVDGALIEGAVADYFTVDANGRVTAKAKATEGMFAVITCTRKSYAEDENTVAGSVTVQVQPKKVTAVKFDKTALEVVGLKEQNLTFTTTYAKGYSEVEYEAFTSDAEIATATVKDGQAVLTPHKYGTVTVTLCADYAITATCKVTIYPVARGTVVAKESTYLLQQAKYNSNDSVQLEFVDAKKKTVDADLFSYKSSNPDMVYVDENGVAYANALSDGKVTPSSNQVIITATLKDDPDKRKVTTKVTVCTKEQIERMDVSYYATATASAKDVHNMGGTTLTDRGAGMVFSKNGQQFALRVISYGVMNEKIENAQLRFTSSDTALAKITSQTIKTFTDSNNNKYQVWEAVVTVQQSGRFSIDIKALDQKQYTRSIPFVAYSAKPILVSKDLGTINRNAEIVMIQDQVDKKESLASDKDFMLLGSDGTEITSVSVESAKVKMKASNKIETLPAKKFAIREIGDNTYRLYMLASEMDNVVDGTYTISLKVKRTLLGTENEEPGYVEEKETTTASLDATFKITSTVPKLNAARITLNTFIRGEAVKIPIDTKETIESVSIVPGMMMAEELDVFKYGKDWYAKIKDAAFDNWKKTSTSGVLYVKLKGYETPIAINLNVTCKSVKPVVKQAEVPSIQLEHSGKTYVTLIDGSKQLWKDYTADRKASTTAQVFNVESQADGKTKITFVDPSMKLRSQGATFTEKVLISKKEWRSPIEVSISVKAYNGITVPTVGFEKTTLNINKTVKETQAETKVKISHSNVVLKEGEWKISDTCKYRAVEDKKTVWHQASEAFKVEYAGGVLKVSLRDGVDVPNGTYRLTMTQLWDEKLDEELVKNKKQPLSTSALSVVVKQAEPKVTINMSGQLDLVNRGQSTLKGTITVSNMNSVVQKVSLVNDKDASKADSRFYCVRKDNTFTIFARSNAALTTSKTTCMVKVTMSDGNVLYQSISITPKQSVPSVITPANETIYKSSSAKTVNFNFYEKLTEGVRIADIEAASVPAGLKVQHINGRLYVTLANKSLKQGKYKIVVDVYFKGAQAISGESRGKAVRKTVYVEVKE